MGAWRIELMSKKPRLANPILIEGLPGIGNVGKVVVDFIVEKTKATRLFSFKSNNMPHSVFVNDQNLVQLPSIEMYYVQRKRRGFLLLVGDVQPIDEVSCYEFSDKVLDVLGSFKGKELITIGGIGLDHVPRNPKIYCTGNRKDIISKYKQGTVLNDQLYGVVGPIMGVSGLLVGLATRRNIAGISLLAETYGHPMYLGIRGAREVLKILNQKLGLDLDLRDLDKQISQREQEAMKRTEGLAVSKPKRSRKLKDMSYIG
jgi:hypothetical protein